jgi:heme/copper-type cytochrome/quinol oxidase subunit 4
MYKFLIKNGQQVAFGVGLLLTIIFFVGAFSGDSPERFNFGLIAGMALSVICLIAMVIAEFYHGITNPKESKQGMITFAGMLVLFGILYAVSKTETDPSMVATLERFKISESLSKMISAGIYSSLFLILAAAAAFAFFEVRNFFK